MKQVVPIRKMSIKIQYKLFSAKMH